MKPWSSSGGWGLGMASRATWRSPSLLGPLPGVCGPSVHHPELEIVGLWHRAAPALPQTNSLSLSHSPPPVSCARAQAQKPWLRFSPFTQGLSSRSKTRLAVCVAGGSHNFCAFSCFSRRWSLSCVKDDPEVTFLQWFPLLRGALSLR